ncbi:response regulator transcription factor [Gorillibacterium timonense]|uniref:response regulator transcription factor n=1 Tax=Gorillibacterium timonense TaxID=1689269 RepID=UPI00071E3B56|nr:response regulator transcription factor [Gorillibacterium timonense]
MRLLLIEDDGEIREMLESFLRSQQFEVETACDGEEACVKFAEGRFDLILLDLMIPRVSGLEVLQRIRNSSTVPILILSARDTDSDITLGLGLGADDYVTKPFSVVEVLARIKANLRRTTQYAAALATSSQEILTVGELTMNLAEHSVMKNGERIDLTAKEYDILKLLMQNPKKVYTKEQLYSTIWKEDYFGDENAVNVHISRLRNKVEDHSRDPRYVLTVWGIGYKLGGGK